MNENEKAVLKAVLEMLFYLPDVPDQWKVDTFHLAVKAGILKALREDEDE